MSGRRASRARKRRTFRAATPGRAPAGVPRSDSSPRIGGRPGGGWPSLAVLVAAALARSRARSL